ncbi:MAG: hypothetical protein KAX38_01345 [Candidatus Krumholzibacteria bacterium]|nr:hypothetical protein [Candidatus Krumholzibacteria bacterium]
MALAVILLVVIFLSINWYYYQRTKKNLDDGSSFRLRTLASLISSSMEPADIQILESIEPMTPQPDTLISRLRRMSAEYELSNILVVREDGVTLLALQPDLFPPGEEYPHWSMDYPAIIGALEGMASATSLYRAPDGTYLRAGYAPLPLDKETAGAVVAVEASADFLKELNDLRAILLAATGASIIGMILFTWFVLKATTSLIKARESLVHAETLSSMGRMAAGIAHEIRNPLFIIRSSAEKLKGMHPDNSDEIDSFITEEVDRLDGILTDYLLFARDEPMGRHPMDLVVTLDRSVRLVKESIEGSGIELTADYIIEQAPFAGEEKRIEQSFLNILLNAQQSITDKGQIKATLSAAQKSYVVKFEDNGSGIDEKELENIFEPFYTTKPAGSGLGLAIVKKIVEDHRGQIGIESNPGTGTIFTITLPRQEDIGGTR